jgi:hypothetical protein
MHVGAAGRGDPVGGRSADQSCPDSILKTGSMDVVGAQTKTRRRLMRVSGAKIVEDDYSVGSVLCLRDWR